ncbi:MAG: hypothetical protein WCC53_16835 [Thermoanaerobaculia bacterium]
MKRTLGVAAGVLLVFSPPLGAAGSYSTAHELIHLTLIKVEKKGGGAVNYTLEGFAQAPGFEKYRSVNFHTDAGYDPNTRAAKEKITFPTGTITATMTCEFDPWMNDVACTGGLLNNTGEVLISKEFFQAGYPLSARRLLAESRERLRQAFAAAPNPTPTRRISIGRVRTPTPDITKRIRN